MWSACQTVLVDSDEVWLVEFAADPEKPVMPESALSDYVNTPQVCAFLFISRVYRLYC